MFSAIQRLSIPLALGAARFIQSLLYGVEPNDPGTIAMAVAILTAAALAAGYLPARRASCIDPITALRHA